MGIIKLIIIFIALFSAGCEMPVHEVWVTNQELRTEIFFKCMESLPAGPKKTKYNDWDEVIAECRNAAYALSRRVTTADSVVNAIIK